MGIFDKKTTTNTSNTTNAFQTNVGVGDYGLLVGDGSNVTTYRDESQNTQLFDSRDLSTTITDNRDMSLSFVDNSQTYDLSEQVARDALEMADRQNILNAGLWSQAIDQTLDSGLQYAAMTGEAWKNANASVMTMASNAISGIQSANASDGEALASSLEKFGKMGVVLILGIALFGAMRGSRG